VSHLKIFKKLDKNLKISKIFDIFDPIFSIYIQYVSMIYIADIYQANPVNKNV